MSKAAVGARILYCNHQGYFIADIFKVEGVNVVRANRKVTPDNLVRDGALRSECTHHMTDFPIAGFWRPDLGVFVVPKSQVKELK
jgi:hypothetical protein